MTAAVRIALARIATPFLAPILIRQGRRVRTETLRLPEAEGPRAGVAGEGPPIRLLVVGDSSAAGVGADTQSEALLGRTVARLSERAEVTWQLTARTGWRTEQALAAIEELDPSTRFDVAVTALGVNDATARVPIGRWLGLQRELRARLRARGVRRIAVSGLPPVSGFPALPQPLRWWLGARADRMSRELERDVAEEPDAAFVGLDFTRDVSKMASDGFHPGPDIYREWGRRAAGVLVGEVDRVQHQVRDSADDVTTDSYRRSRYLR